MRGMSHTNQLADDVMFLLYYEVYCSVLRFLHIPELTSDMDLGLNEIEMCRYSFWHK